jgi:prepilin-type N-terminal cleavage/methylation domain-containing protein
MNDEPLEIARTKHLAVAGTATLRRGFSLMEVILTLAILAGAMTVLGQLISLGNRNAIAARDLSYAQILCASKMDEIRSGLAEPTAVSNATSETDPTWVYSIEANQTDTQGILALRVTFTQGTSATQPPISFSLTGWVPDPGAESTTEPTDTQSQTSTGSSQ